MDRGEYSLSACWSRQMTPTIKSRLVWDSGNVCFKTFWLSFQTKYRKLKMLHDGVTLSTVTYPFSFKVECDVPVNVRSISIYETYNAGAVVKVSLRDPDGNWIPVWTGDAQNIKASRIFQPPLQVQVCLWDHFHYSGNSWKIMLYLQWWQMLFNRIVIKFEYNAMQKWPFKILPGYGKGLLWVPTA